MKCGLVGLPNVGKSTLFNAFMQTAVAQAANYPFCTIEPNVGTVCVPDYRLKELAQRAKSETCVPTQITFVDIAGLVKGASKGEGLGNQFLNHIRNVDAILHVVRCFEGDVIHVANRIDPLDDIDTLETELMLADLQSLENRLAKKKLSPYHALLEKALAPLQNGHFASTAHWTDQEKKLWPCLDLLTLKPMIYVCNVAENDVKGQSGLCGKVKAYAQSFNRDVIALCNQLESEISSFSPQDQSLYLSSFGLESTGLDHLIRSSYHTLNLITFFTAGPKEVRAWTIDNGGTAFDAAGAIHTDFQKGFIRAEVISYGDYVSHDSLANIKESGKIRSEGRDYSVQDGDVMLFRFNV
jgi:GTP-binding protein YchF